MRERVRRLPESIQFHDMVTLAQVADLYRQMIDLPKNEAVGDYLDGRGIGPEERLKWQIGWCEYGAAHIVEACIQDIPSLGRQ